jgi:hypothetical protein
VSVNEPAKINLSFVRGSIGGKLWDWQNVLLFDGFLVSTGMGSAHHKHC